MIKVRLKEAGAVKMLDALGNRTRLRLFRLLAGAGPGGLNVGQVQERLGVPASTLAHHLTALVRAGVISQRRKGREVRSMVNYEAMDALTAYITECNAEAEEGSRRKRS